MSRKKTYTFRLSHSKSTSRERNTSRRRLPQSRLRKVVQLVLGQKILNLLQVLRRDIGDNQMLVSRHPEVTLVNLGNLLQTGLEMLSGFILDTTVLNETGEVVLAILTG